MTTGHNDAVILGIESSCDETAAAVVIGGRRVLSNRVASQVPLHQRYGGVVPEIASRAHLEAIVPVVEGALADAALTLADLDAVAVTRSPGLVGCLLVGVEFAKAICVARSLPLVAVHHVAGHLYSPYIGREIDAWGQPVSEPIDASSPFIAYAVSGGHSSLVLAHAPLRHQPLGETLDDAVGEAYDKVAKVMGLGYPGGPLVDHLAHTGNPTRFDFPRPMKSRPGYDLSFSGLKSAVARRVEQLGGASALATQPELVADICASFQAAAVDLLVTKAKLALREHGLRRLAVTGGVACNKGLRKALTERLRGIAIALPDPEFCTDNAAMIAGAAAPMLAAGLRSTHAMNAVPSLGLCDPPQSWQQ